jgi:hypothetical protein
MTQGPITVWEGGLQMHDYGSPVRTESTVEPRMMVTRSENVCVIGIASQLKLASENSFVQSQSRWHSRHA